MSAIEAYRHPEGNLAPEPLGRSASTHIRSFPPSETSTQSVAPAGAAMPAIAAAGVGFASTSVQLRAILEDQIGMIAKGTLASQGDMLVSASQLQRTGYGTIKTGEPSCPLSHGRAYPPTDWMWPLPDGLHLVAFNAPTDGLKGRAVIAAQPQNSDAQFPQLTTAAEFPILRSL